MEDLRQKCIYNQAYSSKHTRTVFWHYITVVHDECESNLNEDCSKYAHEKIRALDWDETQSCAEASFSNSDKDTWIIGDIVNTVIEEEVSGFMSTWFDGMRLVINNSSYRG